MPYPSTPEDQPQVGCSDTVFLNVALHTFLGRF